VFSVERGGRMTAKTKVLKGYSDVCFGDETPFRKRGSKEKVLARGYAVISKNKEENSFHYSKELAEAYAEDTKNKVVRVKVVVEPERRDARKGEVEE
jgi:hypothetical protein